MNRKTNITFSSLPKDYGALVRLFAPRPIRDRVGYENTCELVNALAGHVLNSDQEDYLEILSQMIERYEAGTMRPRKKATGQQLLQALVEEHRMSAAALGKLIGVDGSHAAKVLRGDRSITASHAKKLSARFAVATDALLA